MYKLKISSVPSTDSFGADFYLRRDNAFDTIYILPDFQYIFNGN
jgi:hypothetical protein